MPFFFLWELKVLKLPDFRSQRIQENLEMFVILLLKADA